MFLLFTFLAHRFLPKYDVLMQLLMFQVKMLRDRIDDQRIVPTPEERAEVRCIRIPPKAPQANAFCESFIGTCKHQCLNHFVCFGLGQLAHINRVWLDYYHTQRPHQGTGNNVISAAFRRETAGPVKRQERLGTILAWYEREAARPPCCASASGN